jgi:hypothetical protein
MDQACPLCGAAVPVNPRYPQALCRECAALAGDVRGRPLAFANESMGGGFEARYADTGEEYLSHECWVRGVRCWADEARFGGIVIQPIAPPHAPRDQV